MKMIVSGTSVIKHCDRVIEYLANQDFLENLSGDFVALKTKCIFGQIAGIEQTVILDYDDLQLLNFYEGMPFALTLWDEAVSKVVPENAVDNVIRI